MTAPFHAVVVDAPDAHALARLAADPVGHPFRLVRDA